MLSRLLSFITRKQSRTMTTATSVPKSQVAIFAAGCFWGVEHIFLKQWPIKENKGILKSAVGYTGGRADSTNPTYRDVCSGNTNHAEALRIEFDPSKVTYDELVGQSAYSVDRQNCLSDVLLLAEYFYCTHDPTTLNSQGLDHGTRPFVPFFSFSVFDESYIYAEYRSAIFFNTPEQESIARRVTQEVQEKHFSPKGQQIVTVIEEAGLWYDAEDYHQEYLFKNPSGYQCATHRLHW
jgi:peptide-methionine (S)-S-oxide reductase